MSVLQSSRSFLFVCVTVRHGSGTKQTSYMATIPKEDVPRCMEMMEQLIQISNADTANTPVSTEVAWEQRKCRKLNRYPTV